MKWTEGCHTDPKPLWIQPGPGQTIADVTTSEVPALNDIHFAMVDERAYQPANFFEIYGWPLAFLDSLIEPGRNSEASIQRRAIFTLQLAAPPVT